MSRQEVWSYVESTPFTVTTLAETTADRATHRGPRAEAVRAQTAELTRRRCSRILC